LMVVVELWTPTLPLPAIQSAPSAPRPATDSLRLSSDGLRLGTRLYSPAVLECANSRLPDLIGPGFEAPYWALPAMHGFTVRLPRVAFVVGTGYFLMAFGRAAEYCTIACSNPRQVQLKYCIMHHCQRHFLTNSLGPDSCPSRVLVIRCFPTSRISPSKVHHFVRIPAKDLKAL
jgi:hypothetical protein